MRLAVLAIPLLMLVLPFNFLEAKQPSYWDYFREPDRARTSWYDIDFSLVLAGPVEGKMQDEAPFGLGFLLGFHYQKKFFRSGLEVGYTHFPGQSKEDEQGEKRTDMFGTIPVMCDLAFDIRCARVFSLVPFISLGFSIDILRFIPPGDAFEPAEYETRVAIHQVNRLGLGFWFHLNSQYTLQINAAYMPLVEYGNSVTVINLMQLSLGFARRF